MAPGVLRFWRCGHCEKILIFSFYCMSDQGWRSLTSYLKPISGANCACILTFISTEMQYVMYPSTFFYYSFTQYTTNANILKINEIPRFLFFKATKYTILLGLHLLPPCTYLLWLHGTEMYVIFIHTQDTECMYCVWQMTHQHGAYDPSARSMYHVFSYSRLCNNIHITVTMTTTKYRVVRK